MRCTRLLAAVTASTIVVVPGAARAAVVEIESTISGGIHADGLFFPGMMNYFVGYSIPSTPIERRNWFLFDLAGVSETVVSGRLKLYLPGDHELLEPSGYVSSDSHEVFRISGSPAPSEMFWDMFLDMGGVTPGIAAAIFGTLGSGAPFGITTVTIDDSGRDVVIELTPTAIDALNASLGSHFVIGGRLTDIHPDAPGMPPSELVFAYTDIPHTGMPLPRLELDLIPAPSSGAVLATAGLLAARRRRPAIA